MSWYGREHEPELGSIGVIDLPEVLVVRDVPLQQSKDEERSVIFFTLDSQTQ